MLMHYTYMNFKKDASRRGLIMSRNPGIASHRYPIMYSGVTEVSWKTLKYLPFYNISSSNIGLTWWSHDIGGYENGTEELQKIEITQETNSKLFEIPATYAEN